MIDIRQTEEYSKYLKTQGWNTEEIGGVYYFIKKIPVLGSVIKVQRPAEIRFEDINKLAQKYRAFQIIIEPRSDLEKKILKWNGYKLSKHPFLPSKTLILDLTKTKTQLIKGFKKDAISAIKKSGKVDIREVRTKNDIKNFQKSWKKIIGFKRSVPSVDQLLNLNKTFAQNPPLFLASHNNVGKIIGGAIFTKTSHGTAYYWQAFTSKEGRSTLSQYSLLYKALLWAKSKGCKVFDFEGIFDSRFPDNSWLGFTHFKKSFGGDEVSYPGCFTKIRIGLW